MENDAQLLGNRISLLRQANSKARKKIQEAKRQAKEIRERSLRRMIQVLINYLIEKPR